MFVKQSGIMLHLFLVRKIRGIFLEGPFFSEIHKGAQNPKYMGDPKSEILDEWQQKDKWLGKENCDCS